jgi:hypothetical protein
VMSMDVVGLLLFKSAGWWLGAAKMAWLGSVDRTARRSSGPVYITPSAPSRTRTYDLRIKSP